MPNTTPSSSSAPTTTAIRIGSTRTCGVSALAGVGLTSGLKLSNRPWSASTPGQLVVSSRFGRATVARLVEPGNELSGPGPKSLDGGPKSLDGGPKLVGGGPKPLDR